MPVDTRDDGPHRQDWIARPDTHLLDQVEQIAIGLSATFAPFCEVVVHDLTDPAHAITAIHNNLSGRRIGEPATDLGLARIADPDYPQVISNYANHFSDGRRTKSTSIGIKDKNGTYVAALCLNIDLTLLQGLQSTLKQFIHVDTANIQDPLNPIAEDAIRTRIDAFAARLATSPRALRTEDRRALLRELKASGCLHVRRSTDIIAAHLGVSRTTIYADVK